MSFEQLLSTLVILFYSLGSLCIFIGTLAMRRQVKIAANWFTLIGFVLHTFVSIVVLATHSFEELSGGYFMQLLAWILIFLYISAWRLLRVPFLALTAAPLALLLYILSMRLSSMTSLLPENLAGLFMGLHVGSLFISLGLLAMAFGSGLLFIYMEAKIKSKTPIAEFARDLPALSTYDKINRIAVVLGFPLYTFGLMSSIIWLPLSQNTFGNPKVMLSMFIWFLYALLFYQRMALGYQGRKTAIMAIIIFLVSAASIVFDFTLTHHSKLLQP